MSAKPEDEAVKEFQLKLEVFGKRNLPRLRLIEDLELGMLTCKTPEVQLLHKDAMRNAVAELYSEEKKFNDKMDKWLRDSAKKNANDKNAKETDFKKSESAIRKTLDKFTSKYLGGIKGLAPKVDVKGSVSEKGKTKVKKLKLGLGGKF